MTYTPSPRPSFDGPTHIPYSDVSRHLWGDEIAGVVIDWIYVSGEKIHQIMFELKPGEMFRHSEAHRTIFAADEIYYVLSGVLMISNPGTGEVHRVLPGEAAFFRRDTWHHALSAGDQPVRVLEYFAPPPSQGTSGAYARTQPYLSSSLYMQDEWLTRWPMAREEAQQSFSIRVIRETDALWRLEGRERPIPVGLLCSTEHLTVGTIRLLPGQQSEPHRHGGDEGLYVAEGTIHLRLTDQRYRSWFELTPNDGFFIPQGVAHQYYNPGIAPARLLFGIAPQYLPSNEQ